MNSLIEQAARRLEQLRQAGVADGLRDDAPLAVAPPIPSPVAAPAQEPVPSPAPAVSATVVPAAGPGLGDLSSLSASGVSRRVELNLDALEAAGVVTPQSPRSVTADQYRVIKRPLLTNAKRKGPSALPHGNLPACIKYSLQIQGVDCGVSRQPMAMPDAATRAAIEKTLRPLLEFDV